MGLKRYKILPPRAINYRTKQSILSRHKLPLVDYKLPLVDYKLPLVDNGSTQVPVA